MRIDIITCVPNLLDSFFAHSILKRAQQGGFVEVMVHDIRDYSVNKHRTIDDYAFGGGAGMVLQIEPIAKCIRSLQQERDYDEIIYLTPDGELMQQHMVNQLSLKGNIIMLCGHYKGVDQRVRDMFVTKEVSIGDYVLSGGELAAAVLSDAIIRLLPGVLNDETSALTDSFQDNLLAPPVYTRPAEFEGHKVPDILMSGHEAKIEEWRYEQSIQRTRERRPDLLKP
ncbi:tRNA (guanosine(37)-N1)-methyltransferase TrmD [Dyadobacter chenwenxiniae]|uniref:tRNA (guanine-N(1)-)-methyltransferase n=1 Tax=Dyadobacter chenwenxiniae TaxID=2906456 RepID=A0A9X1TGF6_9BACT|nr:tRNA (guanosine(37)-N1)-methyltransferase TrmD [Dyadobacter chenwenxiniae]MCF0063580.1 tRNA (guanosine(37)-N1)-methyltransferase TrmD [Dyadobacter chenwenxiniae]UON86443.1 tRNA (guanosine(37)-N1)-methyltransferase TrmD [Dyadobacter chenwenxiniae]